MLLQIYKSLFIYPQNGYGISNVISMYKGLQRECTQEYLYLYHLLHYHKKTSFAM